METFPDSSHVEVELLVSGVCTMAAVIPASWSVMRKVKFRWLWICRLVWEFFSVRGRGDDRRGSAHSQRSRKLLPDLREVTWLMAKSPKRVLYGATLTFLDRQCIIGKSWMMFTMFGLPPEFDLVLEEAAVEARGPPC